MEQTIEQPAEAVAAPQLLKARRRHTIFFVALLLPIMLFTKPLMPVHTTLWQSLDILSDLLLLACILGRSYSTMFVGGKKNAALVQEGVYATVRNPLYVFSFLGLLGIGIQSGRLSVIALLLGTFFYYYPKVVAKEEGFLRHKFGKDFDDYCARTPRWIPNIKLWHAPDEMTVQPRMVLRTMRDAALFYVPVIVFEIIGLLQQNHVLPIFARVL